MAKNKLKSLDEEQNKIIDDLNKEFVSPLNRELNEEFAKDSLETVCRICGLSKPTIYIVDSPKSAKEKIQTLNKYKHGNNKKWAYGIEQMIEYHILRQEIVVRRQIANLVEDNIKEIFRERSGYYRRLISLDFLQNVHDRICEQTLKGRSFRVIFVHNMIKYLPWLSFYLHFKRLGILENELFDVCYKYSQSGIFMNMYIISMDSIILIKNPLYIISDDRGRMTNKDGYAIEWSDGYGMHFVSGVHFDKKLYNCIFVDKTIKGKDILLIKDTEQKTIAIQQYGYYNMIKDLNAVKIGEMSITTKIGPAFNELYQFELGEKESKRIRGRFVKVVDHSTGKITCLGVPIEQTTETVRGAIAWTFQLDENTYRPYIET